MSAAALSVTCRRTHWPDPLELAPPEERGPNPESLIKVEPRTLIWRETLPDGSPAVLKMYRRRRRFEAPPFRIGRPRVHREYDALRRLHWRGVPCTEPLFWAQGRAPDYGRFELLATREIEGALPLSRWLDGADAEARDAALRSLFRTVRAMHGCGVRHGALSFKNVLLREAHPAASPFIADLARSVLFPHDLAGSRMAWFDLADLSRKVTSRFGSELTTALLLEYGLSRDEAASLVHWAEGHAASRHQRRRLRLEFRIRALASHSAARPSLSPRSSST